MALTRPDVYTDREAAAHGAGWRATHDGMFEECVRQVRRKKDAKLAQKLGQRHPE